MDQAHQARERKRPDLGELGLAGTGINHRERHPDAFVGGGTAGFDTLHRHQEDLHFSIDSSAGVVDVEANDGAAFTEFQRRCASK